MRRCESGMSRCVGAMALSQEDIEQASDMLITHERRLRIRDKQIARHGDNVAPEIVREAEDWRRKSLVLKAVLEPEIPDELSGLVKRRLEDDYFIFQQTLGAKQDVALLREDVITIKKSQDDAAKERVKANDRLGRIEVQVEHSEVRRATGSTFYRAALLTIAAAASIACVLAIVAIVTVIAMRGGL